MIGSGTAKELRSALNKFENQSKIIIKNDCSTDDTIQKYIKSAQLFERMIREVGRDLSKTDFRERINSFEQNVRYSLRIGGVVLGGTLAYLISDYPILGYITGGGAFLVDKLLPPWMKDKVIMNCIDKKFYPGLSNMWRILKNKQ